MKKTEVVKLRINGTDLEISREKYEMYLAKGFSGFQIANALYNQRKNNIKK